MKRALLSVGLALALASPLAAQTVTVGVGGGLSAPVFQDFRVPVFADMTAAGGEKLGSYTVRLSWDPNLLVYDGIVEPGAEISPVVRTDSAYLGVLKVSGVSVQGVAGLFDLFRGVFYLYQPDTTVAIDLQVSELSAATTFTDLLGSATVNVVNGAACSSVGRWGDLDADGLANSRDALAILSDVVGLTVNPSFDLSLADVDGDGLGNTRDALIILSYAVGLQIPGQRVLLIAPGPCATPVVPTLAIVPDTADLVVGQAVQLQLAGSNGSGASVAPAVNWWVDDPAIAAVDPAGYLVAHDTGVTTVHAAAGPGVEVSATVVSRARRRTWYVDASVAAQRTIQLGTAKWPFASPEDAFPLVQEGDTVRVRPGTHDYRGTGWQADVGFVLIGDTLADGTRPVLRAPAAIYGTGVSFGGGLHAEVRDLVFRNFYAPIYSSGLRTLVVENVRTEVYANSYTEAIDIDAIDTLIVRNSQFMGDSVGGSSYDGISVYGHAQFVQLLDTEACFWSDGFYGYNIDSLDVQRSEFMHNGGYGVYLSVGEGGSFLEPPTSAAITQSRFVQNGYQALYLYGAHNVGLSGNYFDQRAGGVYVNGYYPMIPGGRFTSTDDTLDFRGDAYAPLNVYNMDTVRIDGWQQWSPPDTVTRQYPNIDANYVFVSNSQFANLAYQGLNVQTRQLTVDNSSFSGCGVCSWTTALGIIASVYSDSGPAIKVTNSTFSNLSYALSSTSSGYHAGPTVLQTNTVDSVVQGFAVYSDSVLATDNVLTRVGTFGFNVRNSGTTGVPLKTAVFQRNHVQCIVSISTSPYGIYSVTSPVKLDGNFITDCDYGAYLTYSTGTDTLPLTVVADTIRLPADNSGYYGLYVSGGNFGPAVIRRNQVRRGQYGMYVSGTYGSGGIAVDSNAVSQTTVAGLYLSPGNTVAAVGIRNTFANNTQDGFVSFGTGSRNFTPNNRFVGNSRYDVWASTSPVTATMSWWADGSNVRRAPLISGSVDTTSELGSDPGVVVNPSAPAALGVAPVVRNAPPLADPQAAASALQQLWAQRARALEARRATLDAQQAAWQREHAAAVQRFRARLKAEHPIKQ